MPIRAQRPLAGMAAVVEPGLAYEVDLDTAVDAVGRPHERVVRILVRWRPAVGRDRVLATARSDRQRVAHDDPARRRLPRRQQRVRPGLVDPVPGHVDPERPEPEAARAAVEQCTEHAGRIEPRDAQPVDRAVRGHQRARVAVGQEPVVGDRGERGRSRRPGRPRSTLRGGSSGAGCVGGHRFRGRRSIHGRSVDADWVIGRHTYCVILGELRSAEPAAVAARSDARLSGGGGVAC